MQRRKTVRQMLDALDDSREKGEPVILMNPDSGPHVARETLVAAGAFSGNLLPGSVKVFVFGLDYDSAVRVQFAHRILRSISEGNLRETIKSLGVSREELKGILEPLLPLCEELTDRRE